MEESAPSVSVIVPVYNVERYLAAAMDSLLAQTLTDIEILCVNDGSTDGSLEILSRFAEKDPRVVVLDGPNGGYGHAVNRGIEAARGRYVGIVEPDDFVDRHMYEELFSAASLPDGSWADVVKGSYWNCYDLEDGTAPYIEPSNLMNKMPAEPRVLNVHRDNEVLFHHPSIWSAIYRRDFLEEHGIRMVEPPGAGWADNPFFFETLCQAKAIAWLPGAYYYYRQTNPAASSYLKDYHVPFDRLRDIRTLLERIGEKNEGVLACLYNREFSYITSVTEKFGFPESDPAVFSLIKEVLSSMDPEVLYKARRGIRKDQIEYYEEALGIAANSIKPAATCAKPKVSVIVPMRDVRAYVMSCLSSLCSQTMAAFEVVVVDCASKDRTAEVAEYFSARDQRFTVLRVDDPSIAHGFAAGVRQARADAILCADPRTTFGKKFLARIVRAFKDCPDAELVLFSEKFQYLPSKVIGADLTPKRALGVKAEGLRARLMIAAPNTVTSKAMKRSLLERLEDPFLESEGTRGSLTSTKAIALAEHVALLEDVAPKRQVRRSVRTPLAYVDQGSRLEQARSTKFDLIADFAECLGSADVERGFHCYAVEAILRDIEEISDIEQERLYITNLKRDCIERYGLLDLPASHFFNVQSFEKLQRLSYLDYGRYLVRETAASRSRAKLISESTAYRLGRKIAQVGPSLLPRSLVMSVRRLV